MNYKYLGIDYNGKKLKGVLEATNESELVYKLSLINIYCIKFKQLKGHGEKSIIIFNNISCKLLSIFCKSLKISLKSGISIDYAINIFLNQCSNKTLKTALKQVFISIEQGKTLRDSLEEFPNIFPRFFRTMIYVGEESGRLEEVFTFMEQHYMKKHMRKKKIINSLIYPIFILIFSTILGLLIITLVIPKFLINPMIRNSDLPFITKLYVGIGNFINNNTVYFIGGNIIFIMFFAYMIKIINRNEIFQKVILIIPLLKRIIIKEFLCDFTYSMTLMIKSGLTIKNSLCIMRDMQNREIFYKALTVSIECIEKGLSIHKSFSHTKLFPEFFLAMVYIGEENGALEESLYTTNEFFEEEFSSMLNSMTVIIEPLLIIFVGIFIGSIIMSVMLPLFSLY